jgi:polyisoprenoid-binding protein YceI
MPRSTTVHREFTGVTGSVTYDPKDLAQDTVEATIDCSTVNTGVDAQLKSTDFFDVAR